MRFQERIVVRDIPFDENGFAASDPGPPPITMTSRRLQPEELKGNCRETDWLFVIETGEDLTETQAKHLEKLDNDPHPFAVECASRVGGRLTGFLRRCLHVVRWRLSFPSLINPVRLSFGLFWSVDGAEWKPVPGNFHSDFWSTSHKTWDDGIKTSVATILAAGDSEPLAHALLHEAWQQMLTHYRSSLMTAVSAAEVGFKEFAIGLWPQTEWLLSTIQSPPLEKMIAEFLPKLPVKNRFDGKAPFIPQSIIDVLKKKAIPLRNKVTHKGEQIKSETLREILDAVKDFLYILDYYAGHTWAAECLRVETQYEIKGIPLPKPPAMKVK
jgi:hypothetical protein